MIKQTDKTGYTACAKHTNAEDMPKLRWGISTGTCAAAAARAAAAWQVSGDAPRAVDVSLPSGEPLTLKVIPLSNGQCGVIKDAGDDLDATDGLMITASVEIGHEAGEISFRAGEGVGTVTLPGLKIPPGEPAINPVPRRMITDALRAVIGDRSAVVTVAIPSGAKVAKKTFNSRLGIEGGLSILGTTGRVRPMDKDALFEAISLELSTHAASGQTGIILTFATTGESAARKAWNLPDGHDGRIVQVANEVGWALCACARFGFQKILVAGHPGKMLKIAAGSFDTHNRVADGRFEALATHVALETGSCTHIPALYACATTEAAMNILAECFAPETCEKIWRSLAARAATRAAAYVFEEVEVAAAFLDNDGAILGASENISDVLNALRGAAGA